MDLKLREGDRLRIETDQQKTFIDVGGMGYEGIAVIGRPSFHYIEVRLKHGQLATLYFPTKRHKKDTDLGWWSDAEVVYAINDKA